MVSETKAVDQVGYGHIHNIISMTVDEVHQSTFSISSVLDTIAAIHSANYAFHIICVRPCLSN